MHLLIAKLQWGDPTKARPNLDKKTGCVEPGNVDLAVKTCPIPVVYYFLLYVHEHILHKFKIFYTVNMMNIAISATLIDIDGPSSAISI